VIESKNGEGCKEKNKKELIMVTMMDQVKAFKEIKKRNFNHQPLELRELSYKYGFDVAGMLQKKIYRSMAKLKQTIF
jgi:hypothetical protein